jgi:hypothetical protein
MFAKTKGLNYYVSSLENLQDLLSGLVYEEDYSVDKAILISTRKKAQEFKDRIDKLLLVIDAFLKNQKLYTKFTELKPADGSLETYLGIRSIGRSDGKMSGMLDIETFDKLQTNRLAVGSNRIVFVDITRSRY